MKSPESLPLRGTLIKKMSDTKEEVKLKGTLIAKMHEKSPVEDAGFVSKEDFPTVDSLKKLIGKTVVQRDGGRHCEVVHVGEVNPKTNRRNIGLIGTDGYRYILNAEAFLHSITTEGGAWKVLKS